MFKLVSKTGLNMPDDIETFIEWKKMCKEIFDKYQLERPLEHYWKRDGGKKRDGYYWNMTDMGTEIRGPKVIVTSKDCKAAYADAAKRLGMQPYKAWAER